MNLSISDLLKNLCDIVSSASTDWGGLHPVVVHFPIALLFITPLFMALALLCQKSAKNFYLSALILMLLGTTGLFLSTSTGDSAAEVLQADPAIVSVLDTHLQLGEKSRMYFSILTGIFLLYIVFYSSLAQMFHRNIHLTAVCLFICVYAFNLIILFNAAHYGAKLVHKHGIKSSLYSTPKK